jgi:hypothetical protein
MNRVRMFPLVATSIAVDIREPETQISPAAQACSSGWRAE